MFATITKKLHIIIGPVDAARRFALRQRWKADEYRIIYDPQTLHAVDPPTIEAIVVLSTARTELPKDVWRGICNEIDDLKNLWQTKVLRRPTHMPNAEPSAGAPRAPRADGARVPRAAAALAALSS